MSKMNRRKFMSGLTITSTAAFTSCSTSKKIQADSIWDTLKNDFNVSSDGILNFNSGSAGVMSKTIFKAYTANTELLTKDAPYQVLIANEDKIQRGMQRLGDLVGADSKQLTLVRNTTEAINIVLGGIEFKEGDEVIYSKAAYPYVEFALANLKDRVGIVPVQYDLDCLVDTDDAILEKISERITKNTRLIIVTHMTHREGFIMPVERIGQLGNDLNIEVLVDGAHVVGQLPYSIEQSQVTYFASSLHKWLYAPLGTGLLYVKKEACSKLMAPLSFPKKVFDSNKKFEYLGTRPFQNLMTLNAVLDFLDITGLSDKNARLQFLANRLINGLGQINGIQLRADPTRTCGIVSFSVKEKYPSVIKKALKEDYKINLKTTGYPKDTFLRASVNLHIDAEDVDYFVAAVEEISKR